jgi:hypothetical protein
MFGFPFLPIATSKEQGDEIQTPLATKTRHHELRSHIDHEVWRTKKTIDPKLR